MRYDATTDTRGTTLRFDGNKDKTVGIRDPSLLYTVLTATTIDHNQGIEKIIPICDELGVGYDITMLALPSKESLKMLGDIETHLNTENETIADRYIGVGRKSQLSQEIGVRIQNIKDIVAKIRDNNEVLYPNIMSFLCTSRNPADLETLVDDVTDDLWSCGLSLLKTKKQKLALESFINGTYSPVDDANTIFLSSSDMARVLSGMNIRKNTSGGFPLGQGDFDTQVMFNPAKFASKVFVIAGPPGMGKSYAQGTIAVQMFLLGYKLDIIDPKGAGSQKLSLAKLIESMRLTESQDSIQVIKYGDHGINVLDMFSDDKNQKAYEKGIFRIMGLDEGQILILQKSIKDMKKWSPFKSKKPITLVELHEKLKTSKPNDDEREDIKIILKTLEFWTSEELLTIFSSDSHPHLEDAEVVMHDLSGVGDDYLKNRVLEAILLRVKIGKGNGKRAVIADEINEMLDNNESTFISEFIHYIGTQGRAFEIFLIIGGQSLEAIMSTKTGKMIISNSTGKIYLGAMNNDPFVPEKYMKYLGNLTESDRGSCIFEVQGHEGIPVQISAPPHIHRWLTGAPGTRKAPLTAPTKNLLIRGGDLSQSQRDNVISKYDVVEIWSTELDGRQASFLLPKNVIDKENYLILLLVNEKLEEEEIRHDMRFGPGLIVLPEADYNHTLYVVSNHISPRRLSENIRKLDYACEYFTIVAEDLPEEAPDYAKEMRIQRHQILDWITNLGNQKNVGRRESVYASYSVTEVQEFEERRLFEAKEAEEAKKAEETEENPVS